MLVGRRSCDSSALGRPATEGRQDASVCYQPAGHEALSGQFPGLLLKGHPPLEGSKFDWNLGPIHASNDLL